MPGLVSSFLEDLPDPSDTELLPLGPKDPLDALCSDEGLLLHNSDDPFDVRKGGQVFSAATRPSHHCPFFPQLRGFLGQPGDGRLVSAHELCHLGDVPAYWVTAVKDFAAYMNEYIPSTLTYSTWSFVEDFDTTVGSTGVWVASK